MRSGSRWLAMVLAWGGIAAPMLAAASVPDAGPMFARDSAWLVFGGDWQPEPGAIATVQSAVDTATASMFPLIRSVARERLMARCRPPARLRIAIEREEITIDFAGSPPQVLPRSGVTANDHGRMLSVHLDRGGLRHHGETSEGSRENVFRLEAGGAVLVMRTIVTSPRLPEPVRFEVRFRRAAR